MKDDTRVKPFKEGADSCLFSDLRGTNPGIQKILVIQPRDCAALEIVPVYRRVKMF